MISNLTVSYIVHTALASLAFRYLIWVWTFFRTCVFLNILRLVSGSILWSQYSDRTTCFLVTNINSETSELFLQPAQGRRFFLHSVVLPTRYPRCPPMEPEFSGRFLWSQSSSDSFTARWTHTRISSVSRGVMCNILFKNLGPRSRPPALFQFLVHLKRLFYFRVDLRIIPHRKDNKRALSVGFYSLFMIFTKITDEIGHYIIQLLF